jgi:hypothetical protein
VLNESCNYDFVYTKATDVQYNAENDSLKNEYGKMIEDIPQILNSIQFAALVDTKGEVYENEATGIGIVFPPEYIGKYTIAQADVGMFAVIHNASYELWKEKYPGSERGALFTIEKWPINQPDDINSLKKKAISLFQTDEYAYFLRRAEPMDCYTDEMENPVTKEYLVLYADEMIKKVADNAYLLAGNNKIDGLLRTGISSGCIMPI